MNRAIFTLALLFSIGNIFCSGTRVQTLSDSTYTITRLKLLQSIGQKWAEKVTKVIKETDIQQVRNDEAIYGPIGEGPRFMALILPILKGGADMARFGGSPLSAYCGGLVATDTVVLGMKNGEPVVHLLRRSGGARGLKWATPGGFHEWGQTAEETAIRETEEEIGVKVHEITLLGTFSNPLRDPRAITGMATGIPYQRHIISIAFMGFTNETPTTSPEATEVATLTEDQVRNTTTEQWFAEDMQEMVLKAFEKAKKPHNLRKLMAISNSSASTSSNL